MAPGLSRPQAKEVGIGKEGGMTGAEVFWARQKTLLWQKKKIAKRTETYCRWSRLVRLKHKHLAFTEKNQCTADHTQ